MEFVAEWIGYAWKGVLGLLIFELLIIAVIYWRTGK